MVKRKVFIGETEEMDDSSDYVIVECDQETSLKPVVKEMRLHRSVARQPAKCASSSGGDIEEIGARRVRRVGEEVEERECTCMVGCGDERGGGGITKEGSRGGTVASEVGGVGQARRVGCKGEIGRKELDRKATRRGGGEGDRAGKQEIAVGVKAGGTERGGEEVGDVLKNGSRSYSRRTRLIPRDVQNVDTTDGEVDTHFKDLTLFNNKDASNENYNELIKGTVDPSTFEVLDNNIRPANTVNDTNVNGVGGHVSDEFEMIDNCQSAITSEDMDISVEVGHSSYEDVTRSGEAKVNQVSEASIGLASKELITEVNNEDSSEVNGDFCSDKSREVSSGEHRQTSSEESRAFNSEMSSGVNSRDSCEVVHVAASLPDSNTGTNRSMTTVGYNLGDLNTSTSSDCLLDMSSEMLELFSHEEDVVFNYVADTLSIQMRYDDEFEIVGNGAAPKTKGISVTGGDVDLELAVAVGNEGGEKMQDDQKEHDVIVSGGIDRVRDPCADVRYGAFIRDKVNHCCNTELAKVHVSREQEYYRDVAVESSNAVKILDVEEAEEEEGGRAVVEHMGLQGVKDEDAVNIREGEEEDRRCVVEHRGLQGVKDEDKLAYTANSMTHQVSIYLPLYRRFYRTILILYFYFTCEVYVYN